MVGVVLVLVVPVSRGPVDRDVVGGGEEGGCTRIEEGI